MGFPFPLLNYSHKIPTKNSTIINLSNTGQDDTLEVLIRSKPFNYTNKNIELFKYKTYLNYVLRFSFSLAKLSHLLWYQRKALQLSFFRYWSIMTPDTEHHFLRLSYLRASSKPFKDQLNKNFWNVKLKLLLMTLQVIS